MRHLCILAALFLFSPISEIYSSAESLQDPGIVHIVATVQIYDPRTPWRTTKLGNRHGYGILLKNSTILTTESLVRNSRLIELIKTKSGDRFTAEVLISDYQANLALLKLGNGQHDLSLTPFDIDDHVQVNSDLEILQFDDTREIQHGMGKLVKIHMNRLSSALYSTLQFSVLTDLNVNAQGAAVINDGKLAGIVMGYDRNTRVASVLPYPTIKRFVSDAEDGEYRGIASIGISLTRLIDPVKREYLNVQAANQGVLVLSCIPETDAYRVLRPNDVILKWNEHPIDNLGFYQDPHFGRLALAYLSKGLANPGDTAHLSIVRDRSVMDVDLTLYRIADFDALIPENVESERASYLVTGGLVIRELTGQYLRAHGQAWQRKVDSRLVNLYNTRKFDISRPGDRVVILSSILPDPVNASYQRFRNEIITAVNGDRIRNLNDVFRIVDRDGDISRVKITSVGVDIALDSKGLSKANKRISSRYNIPKLRFQYPIEK